MFKDNKINYNDKEELLKSLAEFHDLYQNRPVKQNDGGMKSAHLFNSWYALRQLNPKLVIESGVWKGLGTWVIEQAVPDAQIISIDVTYQHLEYKSQKAQYLDQDITTYDWEGTLSNYKRVHGVELDDVVVFLDDHQIFLDRLEFLSEIGIKHILYEDNYPPTQGDTFSPKKIIACKHYVMDYAGRRSLHRYSYEAYDRFVTHVDYYQEMPPIYQLAETRWGDPWTEVDYPTKQPLLTEADKELYPLFYSEAKDYTWICYLGIK